MIKGSWENCAQQAKFRFFAPLGSKAKAHIKYISSLHAVSTTSGYKGLSNFTCVENNMVLTKAYLRYVQSACFGVVCSLKANVVFVRRRNSRSSQQVTQYAACPVLESVVIWDVRRGEKASQFLYRFTQLSLLGRSMIDGPCWSYLEVTVEDISS